MFGQNFLPQFNFVCLGKTFMIMAARGRTKKEDTSIEKIR